MNSRSAYRAYDKTGGRNELLACFQHDHGEDIPAADNALPLGVDGQVYGS